MPLNEEKYFARMRFPFDGFQEGDIVMAIMQFENQVLIEGMMDGKLYRTWVLKTFLKRLGRAAE